MRGSTSLGSINLRSWVRQRTYKSFLVGGAQGALAGALPGLLIGLLNWSSGDLLAWTLLFTLGGAAGGLLRGWTPGHRLAGLIDRYVGWKRFWEGLGLTIGAIIGTLFGLFFIWAIFPVIMGLVLGAQTGKYLGHKLWQVGNSLGWERIWGGLSAVGAAALGFGVAKLAGVLGMNAFGASLGDALLPFAMNGSVTWALAWMLAGGLGGALAGGLAGILADLFGRLSGLVN